MHGVVQVPELLPEAATAALSRVLPAVGIEVAVAGSADEEQAAAEAEAAVEAAVQAEAAEGGSSGAAAAAAVTPELLPEIWAQEREAWSQLLDGSALSEHMEVRGRGGAGVVPCLAAPGATHVRMPFLHRSCTWRT